MIFIFIYIKLYIFDCIISYISIKFMYFIKKFYYFLISEIFTYYQWKTDREESVWKKEGQEGEEKEGGWAKMSDWR